MTKLTLLTKTYCAFAAIGAVAVASTGLSLWGMAMQFGAMERMTQGASLLRNHMEADMHHDTIRSEVVSIIAAQSSAGFSAPDSARELANVVKEFDEEMEQTAQFTGDETVIAARNAAQNSFDTYIATANAISRSTLAGQIPGAVQLRSFQHDFAALEGQMAAISDAVEAYVAATQMEADAAADNARLLALASLLCVLGALAVTAAACRNRLLAPLLLLRGSLAEMSKGHYEAEIAGCHRPDEIGDLANSVRQLGGNLQAVRAEKNAQAEAVVSTIGEGLARMAQGHLDRDIAGPIDGPFERLRQDFNSAIRSLADTLAHVHRSTDELHNAAQDISNAAGDLASRNMQQAASLEETAAAITDLSGRVSSSVEAVGKARSSVDEVGGEVQRGGGVISHAEQAMDRIENASQEISKIISVIDGIAFQTNLLALNAGVEAARAGESGKGFAVVATEVRALAQRSADAASEIKTLIGNSSAEVVEGVRLVRDAGASLRKIADQMDEINHVMEVVHASSTEQGTTLQQINMSARNMDQITQSNAAAAEEVLASTKSVVAAVAGVSDMIGRFSIVAASGARRAVARAA